MKSFNPYSAQIIVAAEVTQASNDKQQLVPMLTQVAANCSAAAVTDEALAAIDLHIAVDRQQHGDTPTRPVPAGGTAIGAMRAKVAGRAGQAAYTLRKTTVEPVFGQAKGPRGFWRFSLRGRQGAGRVVADLPREQSAQAVRAGWTPQVATSEVQLRIALTPAKTH